MKLSVSSFKKTIFTVVDQPPHMTKTEPLTWFWSYLSKSIKELPSVLGLSSSQFGVKYGVSPQFVLGPIIFSPYIINTPITQNVSSHTIYNITVILLSQTAQLLSLN